MSGVEIRSWPTISCEKHRWTVGEPVTLVGSGVNSQCKAGTKVTDDAGASIDLVIYPNTVRTAGQPIQVDSGNSAYQEEINDRRCDVTIALDRQGTLGTGASLGVSVFVRRAGDKPCPPAVELAEKAFQRLPDR